MLLTKDWQLKLTDFGEARAVNLNQVRSASKPRNDSYSFGICLVAMIRGEKDILEFYFQALRKAMKRKTKKGVGIAILNNRMYSEMEWRPLLPSAFNRGYPCLCALIERCWAPKKEDRPLFNEIVKVMQGEVADEVRKNKEPEIVVYSVEDDQVYHERMGKEEVFEEEEETGETRSMISKAKYDAVMRQLKRKEEDNKELRDVLAKKEGEKEGR